MEIETLTARVIQCVIRVHQTLGPGFLEKVYRRALVIEFRKQNLSLDIEKQIVVYYNGEEVGCHRLDFLIERQLILEVKTVENLSRAHYAQLRSYLKATGLSAGLLVNFADHRADFRRVNPP
jgi:GxxExxY protein